MNRGEYRINGGVGFAIKEPSIQFEFQKCHIFKIIDERKKGIALEEIDRLVSVLEKVKVNYNFKNAYTVRISGKSKTHFGFGTGTAIRLACLEALFVLNHHNYSSDLIRKLSLRGGTSGIGIHTYFQGGFVFDLGHKGADEQHKPSSIREDEHSLPLLAQQIKMPAWNVGICIPYDIKSKEEKQEESFFEKTCPIPSLEVYKTLYHTVYGLYAAILEKDPKTFGKALIAIQDCNWKSAERNLYGSELFIFEKTLYELGASSVGMSSLGPSLFFLAKDVENVILEMRKLQLQCDLILTQPINKGRFIDNV